MHKIMISYLVPSYNHEQYVTHLLDSIKQDIHNLDVPAEIIILDDGSSDGSLQLIQQWAETHADFVRIVYKFQENKGITAVFNRLIDLSSGQYIRICASDDMIIAGSTQLMLNEFAHKPELRCVFADGKVIDDKGEIINQSSIAFHGASPVRLADKNTLVKELIQHWCVAGPALLVKRSHYDTMRYDEASKIEDFDLFLSLLKLPNSVSFIKNPVCFYRIHATNTSKTKNKEKRIANIHSFIMLIDKYKHHDILSKYLLPLKYKSKAKICYLQKKYFKCLFNLSINLFFSFKMRLAG